MEQILIPDWLLMLLGLEWAFNKELDFQTFGGAIFLLIWTFQSTTKEPLYLWFIYGLRGIVLVSALAIAHSQMFQKIGL